MTPQNEFYHQSLTELAYLNRIKLIMECRLHRINRRDLNMIDKTDEVIGEWIAAKEHIKEIEEYLKAVDQEEMI